MFKTLTNLFENLGFLKHKDSDSDLSIFFRYKKIGNELSNQSSEYFLIYNTGSLEQWGTILARQTIITLQKNDPAFMKNSSLIILYEDSRDISYFEQEVILVEEDPNYFKKYVLYYTKKEFELLSQEILENNNNKNILEKILELSKNESEFNNYLEKKSIGYHLFLWRILIKIPIIPLKIIRKNQLSLFGIIDAELEKKNLISIHNNFMNTVDSDISEEYLLDIIENYNED